MIAAILGHPIRATALALVASMIGLVLAASTASLTVPPVTIGTMSNAVTVQELAPTPACDGVRSGLTAVVLADAVSGHSAPGTTVNELIIAGAPDQTLGSASDGSSDCCVGYGSGTAVYLASCGVNHTP